MNVTALTALSTGQASLDHTYRESGPAPPYLTMRDWDGKLAAFPQFKLCANPRRKSARLQAKAKDMTAPERAERRSDGKGRKKKK